MLQTAAPLEATRSTSQAAFRVAFAAALLHLLLLALYLIPLHGDLSALVCVDEQLVGRYPFEAIQTGFPRGGYDGQLYYTVARNPWQPHHGHIDDPVRHLRLLYPALAWLFSAGDPVVLLWVLPLLNVLACAGLAWLGGVAALHFGRSPWWGFWLPIVVNAGFASLRDLTDPLAVLAVAGLLVNFLLHWPSWNLLLWTTAALLTREQNVAVVLLVLGIACWQRRWREAGALVPALLVWGCWIVTLRTWYGAWPFAPGTLAVPGAGLTHLWALGWEQSGGQRLVYLFGWLHLLGQLALGLAMCCWRVEGVMRNLVLLGMVLVLVGGPPIYAGPWSFARVFAWLPLGLWLGSVETGRRWPVAFLALAAVWPVLALLQVWVR